MHIGNSALVLALHRQGGLLMSKDDAILSYKASMAIFKSWHLNGAITADDLEALSTKIAEKYGLSSYSIFLENDLLCKEKRVIYGNAKGGHYGQKDNKS